MFRNECSINPFITEFFLFMWKIRSTLKMTRLGNSSKLNFFYFFKITFTLFLDMTPFGVTGSARTPNAEYMKICLKSTSATCNEQIMQQNLNQNEH
mgnify:FL=1